MQNTKLSLMDVILWSAIAGVILGLWIALP